MQTGRFLLQVTCDVYSTLHGRPQPIYLTYTIQPILSIRSE